MCICIVCTLGKGMTIQGKKFTSFGEFFPELCTLYNRQTGEKIPEKCYKKELFDTPTQFHNFKIGRMHAASELYHEVAELIGLSGVSQHRFAQDLVVGEEGLNVAEQYYYFALKRLIEQGTFMPYDVCYGV